MFGREITHHFACRFLVTFQLLPAADVVRISNIITLYMFLHFDTLLKYNKVPIINRGIDVSFLNSWPVIIVPIVLPLQ